MTSDDKKGDIQSSHTQTDSSNTPLWKRNANKPSSQGSSSPHNRFTDEQSLSQEKTTDSQDKTDDELESLQKEIEELLKDVDEKKELSQDASGENSSDDGFSPAQEAALSSISKKKFSLSEGEKNSLPQEPTQTPQIEKEEERQETIEKLKKEIQEHATTKGVEHTYYDDLSSAMGANDPRTMSELLEKSRREEKEKVILSPRSKKNILYIIGSVLLLAGIIFLLSLLFKKKEVHYVHEKVVPSLIRSEKSTGVNLAALTPEEAKQAIQKLLKEKIPNETIHHIYYVEMNKLGSSRRLGVHDVFQKLEIQAPQTFFDSIDDMHFMHGVYREEENHPFLLFTVRSYDQAFEAMKEWEPHMIDDLGAVLDLPDEAFDRSLLEPGFHDDIIQNKNVRVARFLPRDVDKKGEVDEIYSEEKSGDSSEKKIIKEEKTVLSFLQSLFHSSVAYAGNTTGVICRKYSEECFNLQGEQISPSDAAGRNDVFCTKKIDYSHAYGAEKQGQSGYLCSSTTGDDVFLKDKPKGNVFLCYKAKFKCHNDNGVEIVQPTVEDLNNPRYTCMKFPDWSVKPVVDKTGGYRDSPYWMCKDYTANDSILSEINENTKIICYLADYECYDREGHLVENAVDEDYRNPLYTCVKKPDYNNPPIDVNPSAETLDNPNYACINFEGGGIVDAEKIKNSVGSGYQDKTIGDIWDTLLIYINRESFIGLQCDPILGTNCQYNDDASVIATQRFLKNAGLMDTSSPEGQLDVLTQGTLKDFQTINGLNPSGLIDQQTANLIQSIAQGLSGEVTLYGGSGIAAINNYINGTNVGLSAYNEDVQALQIFLYAEGYPITQINGFFDKNTLEALQQFQRDHNLPVTTGTPGDLGVNEETVQAINGIIKDKNYLGSGFELKDGKLIGTGILEGKFGPGFVGETAYADEFKKGDTVLMYTFLDEHTLLITTHESVIREIIKRRALQGLFDKKTAS